jgi:esterase/lipase
MRRLFGWLAPIALLAIWLLRPLPTLVPPAARPAADYVAALDRIKALRARDTMALATGCGTAALLHGARTPRAVVLFHGLTNCPLQFLAFGEVLFDGGDNVLIPRVDHHGLADRMTKDLARLTADEMVALVGTCVDIARGLGDTVIVVGLSSGGVMTAWAAQSFEGVDRAVVIAPTFAPPWNNAWVVPWLARVALHLPNTFPWWDDEKKEALPGPTQCYPRFSTHAVAEAYRLGHETLHALARRAPRAHEIVVVTTDADRAIDLAEVDKVAAEWRRRGAVVERIRFPAALAIPHDMIDPAQVGARTGLVYPELLAGVDGRPAPSGMVAGRAASTDAASGRAAASDTVASRATP